MTPEEQRIAIAEACGWEYHEFGDGMIPGWRHKNNTLGNWVDENDLPDYLNDLNAMHGAVASQPQEFQHAFEVMMIHHSSVAGKLFCRMEASDWADIFLQVKRQLAEANESMALVPGSSKPRRRSVIL